MSERPFMQLYVSDYLGDTRHLSCEQHGAYLLLLMTMWNASGALPDDDAKLARIVCLSVKKWRSIRDDVLAFFSIEDGSITHGRLSKELQKSESKSHSRASAGAEGGRAKALKDKGARLANASVLPQHLPDTITRKNRDANASLERDAQFDQIWDVYPRKVGKAPARKKFDQALKVADFDTILAGVIRYAEERRGEDHSFTKHLATWFGGCHWQDEPAPPRHLHATSPPKPREPRNPGERALMKIIQNGYGHETPSPAPGHLDTSDGRRQIEGTRADEPFAYRTVGIA